MKPAAVINQGEHFVTLRVTTDRPAEIQEALHVVLYAGVLAAQAGQCRDGRT